MDGCRSSRSRGAPQSRKNGPHFDLFNKERQEFISLVALYFVMGNKNCSDKLSTMMCNEQEFKNWKADRKCSDAQAQHHEQGHRVEGSIDGILSPLGIVQTARRAWLMLVDRHPPL